VTNVTGPSDGSHSFHVLFSGNIFTSGCTRSQG
jgi:hypothetical protein